MNRSKVEWIWDPAWWRDVDNTRTYGYWGFTLWAFGGEFKLGRRLYRFRLWLPR